MITLGYEVKNIEFGLFTGPSKLINNLKWIAYVGSFSFPWGEPGSRRVSGICRSIADNQYQVNVCCGQTDPIKLTNLNEGERLGSIKYIGLKESTKCYKTINKKLKQFIFYSGLNTVKWLDNQRNKPACVISYGAGLSQIVRLQTWCRKNRIPFIVDVVEWYHPKQLIGGLLGPLHLSSEILLRYFYPKSQGIIAISSFLEKYYSNKKCDVIRIPPTIDIESFEKDKKYHLNQTNRKLHLIYAGTPGKKDKIDIIINAISKIDPTGKRVKLEIVGPTSNQVKSLIGKNTLPPFVLLTGRVEQNVLPKIINKADFTILVREQLKYTKAGFPTKVVESLANSVPVITNLTSDLNLYIIDKKNGIICDNYSTSSVVYALKNALNLSDGKIMEMRKCARETANTYFDFRNYNDTLNCFLNRIIING